MKQRDREPPVPQEMHETLRRKMLEALEEGPRSARELSSEVRLPEKEVYDHLEHLRKTADTAGLRFIITPAECAKCGFIFSKRERLKKPGKCPVCKGESIHEPLFAIEGKGH